MNTNERVAIIAYAGRFPGGGDLDEYWHSIVNRLDHARDPSPNRWLFEPSDCYSPDVGQPDKVYSTKACFLDDIPIDPLWGDRLDPVFHLVLYVGRQAWSRARTSTWNRDRIGVILGQLALPTDYASIMAWQRFGPSIENKLGIPTTPPFECDPLNRFVSNFPAELLAHDLKLGGLSYCLDAACASSLYSIKLAVDELLTGRADVMLAGGVSRPDSLYTQMGFSQLRALSPTGKCAPFDIQGNGLVVGEGCGIFVLKRLSDACRDGDTIAAVIAGIGLSNDIEGNLLAPATEGQLRAMRAAYAQANLAPADVDLIECHATGTPLGDLVEFRSLITLWNEAAWSPNQCVIGSVKSTVGHLLTAAGSAGLTKVLMALQNETLPPTANFLEPQPAINLDDSPFRILSKPENWLRRADRTPRRAAISAFGFGGINAHVIVEEWIPKDCTINSPPHSNCDIAIVGLDAHIGKLSTLQSFQNHVFQGLVADRSISELKVGLDRFRIPPNEWKELLPQQILALQVSARALQNANVDIQPDGRPRHRDGVVLGVQLDHNTTNFHLRWMMRSRIIESYNEYSDGWLQSCMDIVHPSLTSDRTMGGLASVAASRIARTFHFGGPSLTVSSMEDGGLCALTVGMRLLELNELDRVLIAAVDFATDPRCSLESPEASDGAVAVVLKRYEDALRDGDRVYAIIRGRQVSSVHSTHLDWAIDASQQLIGNQGAFSSLAGIVVAALSLYQQILPIRKGDREKPCQYWLCDHHDLPRSASISHQNTRGYSFAVSLTEPSPHNLSYVECRQPFGNLPEGLFVVDVHDRSELASALKELQSFLNPEAPVEFEARRWWRYRQPDSNCPLAAAFVAKTVKELRDQITQTIQLSHIHESLSSNSNDRTFFTNKPLGPSGELAFVFPGSGNHYSGMGRELALSWPQVIREQNRVFSLLRSQIAPDALWANRPATEVIPETAIFAQVAYGSLTTDIFKLFGCQPDAVLGLSLGESSGLFSLGAWPDRDEMCRRMAKTSLFNRELAGECQSARLALGLDELDPFDWLTGIITCEANQIREVLPHYPRVWLLIVLTSKECVIGGANGSIREMVQHLGKRFLPLPSLSIAHCNLVEPVRDQYRKLHLLPTVSPKGIRFYSGAWGRSYSLNRESAADAILHMALSQIDFPRLVESAYQDGVRLFLEMGPGASASRAIRSILHNRPHMVRSVSSSRESETSLVLRALAQLISERVPIDLSSLYASEPGIVGVTDQHSKNLLVLPTKSMLAPMALLMPRASSALNVQKPVHNAVCSPSDRIASAQQQIMPTHIDSRPISASGLAITSGSYSYPCILSSYVSARSEISNAHSAYLSIQSKANDLIQLQSDYQSQILHQILASHNLSSDELATPVKLFLDTPQCVEFARGMISNVLGSDYALVDHHPTRVRLPDGPLMLVDHVLSVEAEPRSMSYGRVITDHHVHCNRWYIENGCMPTCVTVEAGQADLFLSSYLGIDFQTQGQAVYRLLDAVVVFHRHLPQIGETVVYDIHIDQFFRQGETWLFRFRFEGTVNGEPLISMSHGCAGFFSSAALAAGRGIVHTELDRRLQPGRQPDDWSTPLPIYHIESFSQEQIESLRSGDLAGCFGPLFEDLALPDPIGLPAGMLRLVDRVPELDPEGGRFGLGRIRAELDIHRDDWFLTCHFIDDMVMPGTLMYECCLHSLRILLLRWGWVGQAGQAFYEPVPGVASRLKCRGQVVQSTRTVTFEVTVKERGYRPEPYVYVDALMYADGKPIVEITDMSLQIRGLTRSAIEDLWAKSAINSDLSLTLQSSSPLYSNEQILAFAIGKPSEAFGDQYRIFDSNRVIARLPGPPYQFLHRIVEIRDCEPWKLLPGGTIVAEYDFNPEEWYFGADRQPHMPFAVLLEVALQPCGWFAAYLGSALTSPIDLSFRNLGGSALLVQPVPQTHGTLRTAVKMTKTSSSGGMIVQHYDFNMFLNGKIVYEGNTYFGFFSQEALSQQVGIRETTPFDPRSEGQGRAVSLELPDYAPFPNRQWRMLDSISLFLPEGGPHKQGLVIGQKVVDPSEWFFKAHFYQDPVCPGSLGLESFLQLLKACAAYRWGANAQTSWQTPVSGLQHNWIYRGQIVPTNRQVTVQAEIKSIDDNAKLIKSDGWLFVDGRLIYGMKDFTLRQDS